MGRYVIEAFDGDDEFITYRRADIERFVRAARRTAAALRRQLEEAEQRASRAEAELAEGRVFFKIPHWSENRRNLDDDTAFFESLREPFGA